MCSSEGSGDQTVGVAGKAWLTETADERRCLHFLFLFVGDVGEGKFLVKIDSQLPSIFTNSIGISKFSFNSWRRTSTIKISRGVCP